MAVHIRLRRIGKNPKKKPYFRISVYEASRSRDSRSLDELGFYNPLNAEFKLNKERFDSWVKKGAQVSEAVKNLLKNKKEK